MRVESGVALPDGRSPPDLASRSPLDVPGNRAATAGPLSDASDGARGKNLAPNLSSVLTACWQSAGSVSYYREIVQKVRCLQAM